ncbi:protein NOI4-like [Malania oleifera]|uniref:protein NOI4-like n=1 Tax=Malania oleifera TaxID=397392 RepID=UPI0025AE7A17|nr:protein NOI4-like [Malania oleifera]
MASQDRGRALPKFGEWDVNDPASAEGFTVIFNKARDEKKSSTDSSASQLRYDNNYSNQDEKYKYPSKRRWFCCA